ncbi:uncharacterized protein METZ01_LOCUS282377 [marine metagenome]|uniref:Uncharacterized protein n=1 Tax=marine metagenome TaxID=408172 RepID=A0A382L186_9ZZZZ
MADNKWARPDQPPPPMFLGKKERDLVKQVNDELIERVIGQTIVYYPISTIHTDFHSLYGEAIEKTFLPPVRVYVLIEWGDTTTTATNYGVDRLYHLTCHFHKRRLTEDQDLYVREGDFILYGGDYYEIITLTEAKQLFGQVDHMMEITAKCGRARQGLFDGT